MAVRNHVDVEPEISDALDANRRDIEISPPDSMCCGTSELGDMVTTKGLELDRLDFKCGHHPDAVDALSESPGTSFADGY